jgi:hypothetical protein
MLSLLILFACSPNPDGDAGDDVQADGVRDPVVGTPVATVDADSEVGLVFTEVCGIASHVVEVYNEGDALLELTAIDLQGEGWEVASLDLPVLIGPNEHASIGVSGTDGVAELLLVTNDPERPELRVSLAAEADGPPSIQLGEEAAVVGVLGSAELVALVGDDVDTPADIRVIWESDLDGAFCDTHADEAGVNVAPWEGAERSVGTHQVIVSAIDSCGNSTSVELPVCQEGGFAMDELGLADWNLEGSSVWDETEGELEITPAEQYKVGSAFMTTATVPADAVKLDFEFYMGDGTGADGFAVVALNTIAMNDFLGAEGCGLGYAGPSAGCIDGSDALPGWAIEVDAYFNWQIDPTEGDHVSLHVDGDQETLWAWSEVGELEDTGWHHMTVEVVGKHFLVTVDGEIAIDQEVGKVPDFPAYIGFTGATGGDTNVHRIRDLVVTTESCGD